jgi:hypothetical protein
VNGLSNLHLTTTLTNTGDETLKILNDPRTVLKKMPTNTFSIVHEGSGARPLFSGAKVGHFSLSLRILAHYLRRSSMCSRLRPRSARRTRSPSSLRARRSSSPTIVRLTLSL